MDSKNYTFTFNKNDMKMLFDILYEKDKSLRYQEDKNKEEYQQFENLFIKVIKYHSLTK